MKKNNLKKIVLIDAHALIYRAYHALPPLTSASGELVQAVYGFSSILLRILKELQPDYLAAAFDMPGRTFRHEKYEEYKAHRPETPQDLVSQFGKVKEVVEAFGVPIFEKEGYEADDIIGTLTTKWEKMKNTEIVIVTGDMDALQLVGPRVRVYSMKKGINETAVYDEAAVRERYGIAPRQIVDFKGLKGDPSDNIKGVRGIGEKTAIDLLQRFGSVEGIYAALEKGTKAITQSVAEKLRLGARDARVSRELAEMDTNVPLVCDLDAIAWHDGANNERIAATFRALGFVSLVKRLYGQETGGKTQTSKFTEASGAQQMSLLDSESGEADFSIAQLDSAKKMQEFCGQNATKSVGALTLGKDLFLVGETRGEVFQVSDRALASEAAKKFFARAQGFATHDGKALIHFLRERGNALGPITSDTALAAYVTNITGRDFSYGSVAARELGLVVSGEGRGVVAHFFSIRAALEKKVAALEAGRVLAIELPLVRILADMEERGILLNQKFCARLGREVGDALERITKEVHQLAGEEFNINSSQQLARILFDVLGIKTRGLRKTEKGGAISTRESELEKLEEAHPIVRNVLEYRELAKLKNTYLDVLPGLVNPLDGRIHTTFNQMGTATGRLSSASPNLQNIPILSTYGRKMRQAFVAPPGYALVSFDYSQIELRVAAHLARDEKMIRAFRKGLDIHALTASEVYHVPLDQVTPPLRRAAKVLNFGVLYGMGPHALAQATKLSLDEARAFIDEYFLDFSGVRSYIEETKRTAVERGYVETMFGRRRYIPEINSPNWQLRHEAERMAVNMPIQGTATGDIVKIAMRKVDQWIQGDKLVEDARMLLQVHDELVFEISKQAVARVAPKIKAIMEQAVELAVPVVVDVKAGPNWGEQKSFDSSHSFDARAVAG